MVTTEPKPLTRGRQYELRASLDEWQTRLVMRAPLSTEWRTALDEVNRLVAVLDADKETQP